MLSRDALMEMFRKSHALQRGHFELSSGLHSGHYFQCAQVMQYPEYAAAICTEMARRFRKTKPTVVVGLAAGGIVVSFETARILGTPRSIFTERVDGEMQLRRGFQVTKKDRALIVEDAITTGDSARKVARLVERFDAKVVGIGTIVDRSKGDKNLFPGRKFQKLFSLFFETFPPHDCPLCSEGIPVTRPGRPPKTVL